MVVNRVFPEICMKYLLTYDLPAGYNVAKNGPPVNRPEGRHL